MTRTREYFFIYTNFIYGNYAYAALCKTIQLVLWVFRYYADP